MKKTINNQQKKRGGKGAGGLWGFTPLAEYEAAPHARPARWRPLSDRNSSVEQGQTGSHRKPHERHDASYRRPTA